MRLSSIPLFGLTLPMSLALTACGGGDKGETDDEVGYTTVDTESSSTDAGESGTAEAGSGTADTTADTTSATDTSATDTSATDTSATDTSATDTTATDTTATDTADTNMACQESSSDVAAVPPDVMFLLDRSGSMLEIGFDLLDPNKNRWQSLYESVEGVVGGGADATVAFGAKTFSTAGFGQCGVSPQPDVPIMLNNAALLLATIPGPMAQVNGGTPTNLGLEMTMDYMKQFDGIGGAKFVILITDGGIMCTMDVNQALADAVALISDSYLNFDITTYVVGIAPSNFGPAQQLDAMAEVGGAPKMGLGGEDFYRADDAQQLADALAQVVEDSYATSCVINIEEAPFFPDLTQVVVDGQSFGLVDDCDLQDGFVWTDDTFLQIELCGTACELLGIVQTAQVEFYCDPG